MFMLAMEDVIGYLNLDVNKQCNRVGSVITVSYLII